MNPSNALYRAIKDMGKRHDDGVNMNDAPRTSTSAHTEAPWFIGLRGSQDVIRGPQTECIAVIPRPIVDGHGILSAMERAANAGLIIAAPDLLAACQDCMEDRGDWGAKMYAAIAKAMVGS